MAFSSTYSQLPAARVVGWISALLRHMQTGYVYHYAFAMLIGVALIITWFMFSGGGVH